MFLYRLTSSTLTLSKRLSTLTEVVAGGLILLLLSYALPHAVPGVEQRALAALTYSMIGVFIVRCWPLGALGWANRVTLMRGVLVSLVAGGLTADGTAVAQWQWLAIATAALLLDGIDGFVARKAHCQSAFGARFDMEMDALLILLLCLALITHSGLGLWVLPIGAIRYAFVLAGAVLPWLKAPLFTSWRRKAVCVWQVSALLLALTPLTSSEAAAILAFSALLTLVYSFAVDVRWLYLRRPL